MYIICGHFSSETLGCIDSVILELFLVILLIKNRFSKEVFASKRIVIVALSLVNSNDQNVEYRQSGIANTPRDTC